jgi:hypothetical protein
MRRLLRTVTATEGSTADLVKHGPSTYSLHITSRHTGHGRWGTRVEIEEDERHFRETGRLPVSGPRW